jgi:hypothetical protein
MFVESSLMMEAVRTSETSVDKHFTRQYNPEDSSERACYCFESDRNGIMFIFGFYVFSQKKIIEKVH